MCILVFCILFKLHVGHTYSSRTQMKTIGDLLGLGACYTLKQLSSRIYLKSLVTFFFQNISSNIYN